MQSERVKSSLDKFGIDVRSKRRVCMPTESGEKWEIMQAESYLFVRSENNLLKIGIHNME